MTIEQFSIYVLFGMLGIFILMILWHITKVLIKGMLILIALALVIGFGYIVFRGVDHFVLSDSVTHSVQSVTGDIAFDR
jgi:hypothetical protein